MTANYQSFPGVAGDSRTLDKLKMLQLPELAGKSFLDVGCNEGFFCGFARFIGASRAVGIDHSANFIGRARKRFPDCEFHQQGWDQLPDGNFDVILLASALHYADDQVELLRRLVDKLTPDGVLVLELGIVPSTESEWVKVKRGIDERYFPTMFKLKEILTGYAWKWMGPSVNQDGDPVKRHVLHISRRRPVAYLMLAPPGYGKSTLAQGLFPPANVSVVSGDRLIGLVARDKRKVSKALKAAITEDFSPFRLDQIIERIFAAGLGSKLLKLWLEDAGDGDFALDAYVPKRHQAKVERALQNAGYLPVHLKWERVGPALVPREQLVENAEAFYLSMTRAEDGEAAPVHEATGFVDDVTIGRGQIELRGWALTSGGRLPTRLKVNVAGREFLVEDFEKQLRPDVQTHFKLPHALFGYRARLAYSGPDAAGTLPGQLTVSGLDAEGGEFALQFSTEAAKWARTGSGA